MSDTNDKTTLSDWWGDLRAEFGKIFWPDRTQVTKQSVAVVVVSVIIALLIVFFDMIIQYGVDILVNL